MKERMSLDAYFISIAKVAAQRSCWDGTHVGCVLVRDSAIVATGYNGTPRKYRNSLPKSEESKQYYCHAEQNAVAQAARSGNMINKADAYCTLSPCMPCARLMINAGIARVVFEVLWEDAESHKAINLLRACGVEVVQHGV